MAVNFSHVQKIVQTLVWIEQYSLWESDKETLSPKFNPFESLSKYCYFKIILKDVLRSEVCSAVVILMSSLSEQMALSKLRAKKIWKKII